jgi:hypothetical protein
MPPRKTAPAPTRKAPVAQTHANVVGRKVTRTLTIVTTVGAAEALTKRAEQDPSQAPHSFEVERLAGPADTNARWRFNIPGQMLVVAEVDLPIIEALIDAIKAEKEANQL